MTPPIEQTTREARLRPGWGLVPGAALFVLAAALAGCAPFEEVRTVRYEDLIVDDVLASDRAAREPEQALCADELRFSTPIEGGEELTAVVDLAAGAELVVSGCLGPRARPEISRGGGSVDIVVEPIDGGEPVTDHVRVGRFPRWWSRSVDLGALPAGPVRVRIAADLPPERQILLKDLYVRSVDVERRRPVRPAGAQILLISIDTLRADAIGRLGGEVATPHLDRLIERAEVFTPHYAAASWTKPSHGTLLTGQPPPVHGAHSFNGVLHEAVPTLAERFRAGGMATAGLVFDCLWLNPRFGFARGFDAYRSVHWTLPQMARRASDWMVENRDRPFFYFFHTFEAHSDFRQLPYESPTVRRLTVEEGFGVANYGCRERSCASGLLRAIDNGTVEPLPGEEEILRFLYAEGVRHIDEALGRLFADLEESGLFDQLTIVVTSDHGESFFEHGRLLHGNPWEQVIRVPLIVKWAGDERAGEVHETPSSAVDVAPTLLALAGLEAADLPGVDLAARVSTRPVFVDAGDSVVVHGGFKAMFGSRDGSRRLFELAVDPGELRDLAEARAEVLAGLERMIASRDAELARLRGELDRRGAAPQESTITPEERQRLEALGYVGD